MIEPGHKKLSIRKQARLLGVNRNRLKKKPHPPRADRASDQEVLAALDRLHTCWPFYGQRKLKVEFDKLGLRVNRKRLRRLMDEAGIEAIAPKRWTSMPNAAHRKYPYLCSRGSKSTARIRSVAPTSPTSRWSADTPIWWP
jgi:putative transposase